MLDTNRIAALSAGQPCAVLSRQGIECSAPAAGYVSHNGRALTFCVCARHAPNYETQAWTVTYFARRVSDAGSYSGCIGSGFRSPL